MKIFLNTLVILGLTLAFYVVNQTFNIPHKECYLNKDEYVFSKGNASTEVRHEVINQLNYFQKGYDKRDTAILNQCMEQLFSKDNILIMGTMPNEIYYGYEAATNLIGSDWLEWGDVNFLMDNANISNNNDVVWFSTIGYVKFDLSRFLVLPLRLTGIMVKEDQGWKFQQVQYQFDLDNANILITLFLLGIMLIINFIRLIFLIYKSLRKPKLQAS